MILIHEARTLGLSKAHRIAPLIHATRMHIETLAGFSDDRESAEETLVRLRELLMSAKLEPLAHEPVDVAGRLDRMR